jgi:hypothetical protein
MFDHVTIPSAQVVVHDVLTLVGVVPLTLPWFAWGANSDLFLLSRGLYDNHFSATVPGTEVLPRNPSICNLTVGRAIRPNRFRAAACARYRNGLISVVWTSTTVQAWDWVYDRT